MSGARRLDFHMKPTLCRGLIEAAMISLNPRAVARGVELRLESAEDDVQVRVDRRAFGELILGLIAGAIRRAEKGDVRISIACGTIAGEKKVQIRIRESAARTSTEELAQLTDPAYLALAEALGGRIELQFVAGLGSAVTLILPER